MQLEQLVYSNFKDRTLGMKKRVVNAPHEICIERAKLFTESYKKTKGESPIIRFAKAMEHFLTNMTIKIWDNEFIVGNRATKLVGTPLYPEVPCLSFPAHILICFVVQQKKGPNKKQKSITRV